MKRTIILFFFTLFLGVFCGTVSAQSWYTANRATVAWDSVTMLDNGEIIPGTSSIAYRVYTKQEPGGSDKLVTPADIAETQFTITFTTEGRYFVGVQAIRLEGSDVIAESSISWSSDPAVCDGGIAFGVAYYVKPSSPLGLRFSEYRELKKYLKETDAYVMVVTGSEIFWCYFTKQSSSKTWIRKREYLRT